MTCTKNITTITKFEDAKQEKADLKATNAATRAARRAQTEREMLTEVMQWIGWVHGKQNGHPYYPDDSGVALAKEPKPSSSTLTRFVRTMSLKFPEVVRAFDVVAFLQMVKTKGQPFNVTERCRQLCLPIAREYMLKYTETNAVQLLRRQAVALTAQHATVQTAAASSDTAVTSESRTNNKQHTHNRENHTLTHAHKHIHIHTCAHTHRLVTINADSEDCETTNFPANIR